MKLEIKIPKGWKRVRVGELRESGDRFPYMPEMLWMPIVKTIGMAGADEDDIAIRKINRRGK